MGIWGIWGIWLRRTRDNQASPERGLPRTGPGLCRKLHPCHACASIHYLVAEWSEDSVWRFVSPANMPCSHVIPNVPGSSTGPAKPPPLDPLDSTPLFRPDSVYFILPNEQTSCRTSKQMTFPLPTFSRCPSYKPWQVFSVDGLPL